MRRISRGTWNSAAQMPRYSRIGTVESSDAQSDCLVCKQARRAKRPGAIGNVTPDGGRKSSLSTSAD